LNQRDQSTYIQISHKLSVDMPKKVRNEPVIASRIPRSLHRALIRIEAADDISFEEACEKAAILIDRNSKIFEQELSSRANTLYKKRYMIEMNKARQSIYTGGQQASYDQGYKLGYDEGLRLGDDSGSKRGAREVAPQAWELGYKEGSFRWKFSCKKCNKPGTLTDNEWKKITAGVDGVSHVDCEAAPIFETLAGNLIGPPLTGQPYDDLRAGVRELLTMAPPNPQ
jgi:hypothetical protein